VKELPYVMKLTNLDLLTKVTEKTSTTLGHFQRVEQISCLIRELYPNIRIVALAEIVMVLSREMMGNRDKE